MLAIKHATTGEIQFVESMNGYGAQWAQYGPALPADPVYDLLILSNGVWIEDVTKVRDRLLGLVKATAETRKMQVLTPGGAKSTEYADQAAEVRLFWSLGGTVTAILGVLGLWPADRKIAVFPCAIENAAAFGDTIDKAIARFAAGMMQSSSKQKVAAIEAKGCAAIKAATTAAAARAAYAAISWPTT